MIHFVVCLDQQNVNNDTTELRIDRSSQQLAKTDNDIILASSSIVPFIAIAITGARQVVGISNTTRVCQRPQNSLAGHCILYSCLNERIEALYLLQKKNPQAI